MVEILIQAGADLNQTWNGATPLFQASQNGHAEAVEILIQAGADLNQDADDGATPLFMASQYGHAGVVGILVKAGADPLKTLTSENLKPRLCGVLFIWPIPFI